MIDAILTPAEDGVIFTLAATTASVTKLPPSRIFAVSADQDLSITFAKGGATPTTPTAAVGFYLPGKAIAVFDTAQVITGMKMFNISGTTTANIGITPFQGS